MKHTHARTHTHVDLETKSEIVKGFREEVTIVRSLDA